MARMTKEQRLKELYKDEAMESVFKILIDLGWECRLDEDGNIVFCLAETNPYTEEAKFYFDNADLFISYDDTSDYIEINECCWKTVKMDNYEVVERVRRAINDINVGACITTGYLVNEEEQLMEISCSTNIPYLNDELYLKEYIDKKLCDIFSYNRYLDHVLKKGEFDEKHTRIFPCLNSAAKA